LKKGKAGGKGILGRGSIEESEDDKLQKGGVKCPKKKVSRQFGSENP